ncbi:MAG: type II secretion system secretin GspD [Enterobacterales bacterium]|nr:type II secretion system secretin GspD [Enterobacterales bacterium]
MSRQFVQKLSFALLLSIFISSTAIADKATINQKDTDIGVFIEMVSRLTGKTFIVDPRVRNKKITVISQHEMDEKEIFALFLSVLKVHQFAAVKTGNVYKIEQLQTAKQDSVSVYTKGQKYDGDQLVTRVIKVDNVDVAMLVPLLRTLIPQQGHMAQYKPTNVIVIHDTSANLERIVKIIRKIDKESNEEIQVIELEHASATEVVRILQSLEKQNSGAKKANARKPKFVADERTNSILLSADKKASIRLRALIAQLDSPQKNSGNTKVRHLRYAKAEDLATLIEGVADTLETEDGKKKVKSSRRGNNKEYSIKAHAETNSLVITAPPDIMKSIDSVINQLDIRRQQVHVEAIIVEISESLNKELGVQWLSKGGLINFSNSNPSATSILGGIITNRGQEGITTTTIVDGNPVTQTTPNQGDNGAGLGQAIAGMTGALLGFSNDKSWAALLKMLASDTESNVLSTPSLTTLDNEEAVISIGQEIPVITGSQLGTGNANPYQSVDRLDVGIKLKIKPQINEGNAIVLEIEQEVSGIAGSTSVDIITNKRQINTTVLVDSGQTIVLGGLIDNDVQESIQKVPLLGDIPWLGNLFKSSSTTKRKTNLMVFIRPVIITGAEDANDISSRKYEYMRALQLDRKMRGITLMPFTDPEILPHWNESLALPPSYDQAKEAIELEGVNPLEKSAEAKESSSQQE